MIAEVRRRRRAWTAIALALHTCRLRFSCASRRDRQRGSGWQPAVHRGDAAGGRRHAPAYVCRDFTCRQPVTTVDALEQELETAS